MVIGIYTTVIIILDGFFYTPTIKFYKCSAFPGLDFVCVYALRVTLLVTTNHPIEFVETALICLFFVYFMDLHVVSGCEKRNVK